MLYKKHNTTLKLICPITNTILYYYILAARRFGSMVMPSELEVPSSISDSIEGFSYSGELFNGIYGMSVSVSLPLKMFCSVIS